jgi:glyoxylase-like metal-dependent hydrolase (beta-lactamase superfamily II)
MRLLNNLYVIDGPCFGGKSHIFALPYSQGIVMIDAGVEGRSEAETIKWLSYWGLDKERITHVLITHGHWDHVGLAALWREQGARIVAHRGDVPVIEAGGPAPDNPSDHQKFPPCRVDHVLEEDGTLPIEELNFEVITVPGHSPGSVIYRITLDGQDVWFVGDFICPDSEPEHKAHLWWTGDIRFSAGDLVASCEKVWKFRPDCVLGGHGYLRMGGAQFIPRENYKNILLALPSR